MIPPRAPISPRNTRNPAGSPAGKQSPTLNIPKVRWGEDSIHELRLMQCYLMPDEAALRELSEGVIEKLKLLTDAEFAELEFTPD